jgi:hypothetical protein
MSEEKILAGPAAGVAELEPAVAPPAQRASSRLQERDEEESSGEATDPVPVMQRILDNPFLLLFLGITVPTVFYIIWGVMEIITIPLSP